MHTSFRQILPQTALKILVLGKIMLENPHTFLVKTGSNSMLRFDIVKYILFPDARCFTAYSFDNI